MVIDRSGSMSSCWTDVIGGYKEIVKKQKAEPGRCTFTVAAFDSEYELIEDFSDIQTVDELLKVTPRGSTALLDAIGKTISSVGEKLEKLEESERPSKVTVVINTDGAENSSKEFTKQTIKELIEKQTNIYKWEFLFIGASFTSVKDAVTWGIKGTNTSTYSTKNTQDSFTLLGEKMSQMRSAKTYDAYVAAATFSIDEQDRLNNKE